MTREEFVKKFEVLKKHSDESMAIAEDLHRHLLNGFSVVEYGGELEHHYIELLAASSNINADFISALLYEGGGMHSYGENVETGKCAIEFNVLTAEDLWDFWQMCEEYDKSKNDK